MICFDEKPNDYLIDLLAAGPLVELNQPPV